MNSAASWVHPINVCVSTYQYTCNLEPWLVLNQDGGSPAGDDHEASQGDVDFFDGKRWFEYYRRRACMLSCQVCTSNLESVHSSGL